MSKKERVSAFLQDDDAGTEVEFEGVPDAVVYTASVNDAKEALRIAGKDSQLSEWWVALVICTTEEKGTGEPYFDKSHYKSLCNARGDAKRRLQKLVNTVAALQGDTVGGKGNLDSSEPND